MAGFRTDRRERIWGGQIRKVAGFADTMPMAEAEPEDAANRRVTVMLRIRANGASPPP